MKILHIIRYLEDSRAVEIARRQAGEHEVTLLLLHDAVLEPPPFEGKVYCGQADAEARSVRQDHETLDYPAIIKLVFENDRVITW